MEILLGLVCFALFIMVVGHGMWMLAAFVFRTLLGTDKTATRACIKCGATWSVVDGRCRQCGATPLVTASQNREANRETTREYLRRLCDERLLAPEVYEQVLTALSLEERDRIPFLEPLPPIRSEVAPFVASVQPEFAPVESVEEGETVTEAELVPTFIEPPHPTLEVAASPFVHPLDRPNVPAVVQPRQPSRSWADVIQAFFEAKNIRVGEVLAGLFIVVSSVGLIISLRNTLKQIPYFPAFLFLSFILAFHGAGMYSLKKWKLRTVSRVVLIISLLLVPLSFAAAIVLSPRHASGAGDPLFWLVSTLGISGGLWVSWSSTRELQRRSSIPWTIAIVGASAAQIAMERWSVSTLDVGRFLLLSALPTFACLIGLGSQIAELLRTKRLNHRRMEGILLIGGTSLFAWLVTGALLITRTEWNADVPARLSPWLTLITAAVMAIGALLQQRFTRPSAAAWRTTGTAIAICCCALQLVWIGLAWPRPEWLVTLGLLNAVLLTALAIAADLSPLLVASFIAAAAGSLVAFHGFQGRWPVDGEAATPSRQLLIALLAGRSGVFLMGWCLIAAAISGLLQRMNRTAAALASLIAAGIFAVAVIILATVTGFVPELKATGDSNLAAALLLFTCGILLTAACRLSSSRPRWALSVTLVATSALWLGLIHALWQCEPCRTQLEAWNGLPTRPVLTATLLHVFVCTAGAAILAGRRLFASDESFLEIRRAPLQQYVVDPLYLSSIVSALVSMPWLVQWEGEHLYFHAGGFVVLAATAFLGAYLYRQAWAMCAAQWLAQTALALTTAAWFVNSEVGPASLWDTRHIAVQAFMVGLSALAWHGVRRASREARVTSALLSPAWPTFDRMLLPVGMIVLGGAILGPVGIGIIHELGLMTPAEIVATTRLDLTHDVVVWAAVGSLLLAGLWADRERSTWISRTLLLVLSAVIPLIAATAWQTSIAVASAVRWNLALFMIPVTAAFVRPRSSISTSDEQATLVQVLSILIASGPIVLLTLIAVMTGVQGIAPNGPQAGSFFARIGTTMNYAAPLVVVELAMLAYALRTRSQGYALAGFLVHQGAVNLALILWYSHHPSSPGSLVLALALQANAIAASAYALLWWLLMPWMTRPSLPRSEVIFRPYASGRMIDLPWLLGMGCTIALTLWSVAAVGSAAGLGAWTESQLGRTLGFVAVVVTALAAATRLSNDHGRFTHGVMFLAVGLVPPAAAAMTLRSSAADAHHFLIVGWLVEAVVATVLIWCFAPMRSPRHTAPTEVRVESIPTFSQQLAVALVPWSIGLWFPLLFWTATAPSLYTSLQFLLISLSVAVGFAALGVHRRRQGLAIFSTFALLVAFVGTWLHVYRFGTTTLPGDVVDAVVLALLTSTLFWLGGEVWFQLREDRPLDPEFRLSPLHRFALPAALVINAGRGLLMSFLIAVQWHQSSEPRWEELLRTGEALLTLALFIGMLWDRRAWWTVPGLYATGLTLAVWLVIPWATQAEHIPLGLALATATFTAIVGTTWFHGAWWATVGERWGVSDPTAGLLRAGRWLPTVQLGLVSVCCIVACGMVLLLDSREHRLAAAFVPGITLLGTACLAQQSRRGAMQQVTLLLGAFCVALIGWADLQPSPAAEVWLARMIRLVTAMGSMTFLYGLVFPNSWWRTGDWATAFRRAAAPTAIIGVAALVAVLGLEFALFSEGIGAPVSGPELLVVSLVLVCMIAGLLALALSPERDPLRLIEEGRMAYVYAAQATGVLLFMHIYFVRPALFDTTLRPYWPYLIVGLAFAGVGIGEYFRHRGRRVLAEPLQRTGAFLPLLPAIAFWGFGSQADYSTLLFLVGLVYVTLAYCRQSMLAGIAAAVAANGALWALMAKSDGFSFVLHPQFWLIPPALSALVAAQLNRDRLGPQGVASVRYPAMLVIYLSSTSEMFLRGIGESLWPPIVLSLLSLAGIAAGIAFRIRAFLYLGSCFVLLSLVSMVWHAARAIEHVWPWWAFGIAVGLGILILFGLFEKHRTETERLLERLRQWER